MQVCNGKQAATASLADNATHPAHSIGNVTGHLGCLSMNNTGEPMTPVPVYKKQCVIVISLTIAC